MATPRKELVWLVTGASSGFGYEFVLAALARGEKVIATARPSSFHTLGELRSKGAAALELDVCWPFDKIKQTVREAEKIYGRIDVLFNNAGQALLLPLEASTAEETSRQFDSLVFSGLNLARAVLPGMRARKEGTIVWNGSVAGWYAGTNLLGLYSAAKFCVRGLSQALHAEISQFGLRSLVVEPAFFRTRIIDNANAFSVEQRIPDYEALVTAGAEFFQAMRGNEPGDPKKAVELILDLVRGEGVAKGKVTPTALPFGSDGLAMVENVCKDMLQVIDEWRDVIISTDIDHSSGES